MYVLLVCAVLKAAVSCNPSDSPMIVGPFPHASEAIEYATEHHMRNDYQTYIVMSLVTPRGVP